MGKETFDSRVAKDRAMTENEMEEWKNNPDEFTMPDGSKPPPL